MLSFYQERVQVHLELCSFVVAQSSFQTESSVLTIYNELADLAKGLSLDFESPSRNENKATGASGRPKLIITLEQLQFLRRMRYTWRQIASLLNVSLSTITRRRTELGYLDENTYSLCTSQWKIPPLTNGK